MMIPRPGHSVPRWRITISSSPPQRLPSEDNSGEKIYVKRPDGERLRDTHGHWVVQNDLFNHEGLTQDGIAEAFEEFAAREKLSFF